MIGVVRTLEFCDSCIMVLHLLFLLPILVLEGLSKVMTISSSAKECFVVSSMFSSASSLIVWIFQSNLQTCWSVASSGSVWWNSWSGAGTVGKEEGTVHYLCPNPYSKYHTIPCHRAVPFWQGMLCHPLVGTQGATHCNQPPPSSVMLQVCLQSWWPPTWINPMNIIGTFLASYAS